MCSLAFFQVLSFFLLFLPLFFFCIFFFYRSSPGWELCWCSAWFVWVRGLQIFFVQLSCGAIQR